MLGDGLTMTAQIRKADGWARTVRLVPPLRAYGRCWRMSSSSC